MASVSIMVGESSSPSSSSPVALSRNFAPREDRIGIPPLDILDMDELEVAEWNIESSSPPMRAPCRLRADIRSGAISSVLLLFDAARPVVFALLPLVRCDFPLAGIIIEFMVERASEACECGSGGIKIISSDGGIGLDR